MSEQINEPDYYRVSSGEQFDDWCDKHLHPIMAHLDQRVYRKIISALEHFFRNGFKPGETNDLIKFNYWIKKAEESYIQTNFEWSEEHSRIRFQAVISPLISIVSLERVKKQIDRKLSAAK